MPGSPKIEYYWLDKQKVNGDDEEFLRGLNPQQNI